MSTQKSFRLDINGLRAVAVGAVVLFHAGVPHLQGGFVGVDIFFVISGFLMTQIIVNSVSTGRLTILQFYWMRVVRIVPALLTMVLGLLAYGLVALEPDSLQKLCQQAIGAITFLSNVEFWKEAGYFDVESKRKWLLHTWSLSVEWQFYLIYPIALAGFSLIRSSANLRRALLVAAFGLSLLASIYLGSSSRSGNSHSFAFFMLPTRAWEMLAGALVFELGACVKRHRRLSAATEILGFVLIASALVAFDENTPWPSWRAAFPVLGTALVLLAAREQTLLRGKPFQFVGLISYSVYLCTGRLWCGSKIRGIR